MKEGKGNAMKSQHTLGGFSSRMEKSESLSMTSLLLFVCIYLPFVIDKSASINHKSLIDSFLSFGRYVLETASNFSPSRLAPEENTLIVGIIN